MSNVDIQKEQDGTFTAFLEGRDVCWTGAVTEQDAIAGLKLLFPDETLHRSTSS